MVDGILHLIPTASWSYWVYRDEEHYSLMNILKFPENLDLAEVMVLDQC